MSDVFKKMNLKDEKEIVVLNAPESFSPELAGLKGVKILRDAGKVPEIQYALAFVTKQAEVDTISRAVAPKARGDAQVWFAYPKGTSKKFKCEFNRDNGWAVINGLGWRGIRMVAIDEDWSALRFRRVEYIKSK
jgi:hypothetical protein